jgi:hypothetical protein
MTSSISKEAMNVGRYLRRSSKLEEMRSVVGDGNIFPWFDRIVEKLDGAL